MQLIIQIVLICLILAIPVGLLLKILFKKIDNEIDLLTSYIYALAGVSVIVGFIYVVAEVIKR
ncbi:hypothetical protein IAI10_14920 [Clostridium sp. 19966]|uniref:hypothetical protein n=1 Tax=Clostridium sp. 19966 TaxID=2768166 RepID=UPI0028DF3896|nr:hypothetical protein [Clostridium sp. 19966]MDT8717955.1 hypothetical protein [Clostridium sp. 19966]